MAPKARNGLFHVIVDSPGGSANKYKFDSPHGMFKLSRELPPGMHFPCDFGFIPGTCAEDGDALDVAVLIDAPSFVGCLITVRLLGAICAKQTENGRTVRNDRLVAIAVTPANPARARRLRDVPKWRIDALQDFFVTYNRLQGRIFKPVSRIGAVRAGALVQQAIRRAAEPQQ